MALAVAFFTTVIIMIPMSSYVFIPVFAPQLRIKILEIPKRKRYEFYMLLIWSTFWASVLTAYVSDYNVAFIINHWLMKIASIN